MEILTGYEELLTEILSQNASLSFYMFHGGTSFGYMNGANTDSTFLDVYLPIVTSYGNSFTSILILTVVSCRIQIIILITFHFTDYDALISEAGDYQPKFNKTREILQNFNKGKNLRRQKFWKFSKL